MGAQGPSLVDITSGHSWWWHAAAHWATSSARRCQAPQPQGREGDVLLSAAASAQSAGEGTEPSYPRGQRQTLPGVGTAPLGGHGAPQPLFPSHGLELSSRPFCQSSHTQSGKFPGGPRPTQQVKGSDPFQNNPPGSMGSGERPRQGNGQRWRPAVAASGHGQVCAAWRAL